MIRYVYLLLITIGLAQDISQVPVTFYLGNTAEASLDSNQALYYHVELCTAGVAKRQYASLQLYDSENPSFNTTSKPYVVAQVSVCYNRFDAQCVIAANYKWGVQVEAVPNISWPVADNETDYYIRVMGQNKASEFSMELSFVEEENTAAFPWTSILPFNTNGQSTPKTLSMIQYWKYEALQSVANEDEKVFALGYCTQDGSTIDEVDISLSTMPSTIDFSLVQTALQSVANEDEKVFALGYCTQDGSTIDEVDISLSTMPSTIDFSLVQTWACPQTVDVGSCTASSSQTSGWYNFRVASFILLRCPDEGTKTTKNGLWVKVRGYGANSNGMNYFYLYATAG
eukprot:CAMPEP_0197072032 /NCGR_PEP_ID=MMETSP1384-20130603/209894_1 /TAXON_ID=29189 /ORGANISM="Ammonia sp." /LENGTH=341 /DNA_ID=CAMNT_0042510845 /DNA_START=95 /DNA_END=1120 /DNA_ORIENTATION=+